jgi:hypothetical protein
MKHPGSPLGPPSLVGLLLLAVVCLSPRALAQPGVTPQGPGDGAIEVAVFLLPDMRDAWASAPAAEPSDPNRGLAIQFVPSGPDDGVEGQVPNLEIGKSGARAAVGETGPLERLRQERSAAQAELARARQRYSPAHPRIRGLTGRIGELDAKIRAAEARQRGEADLSLAGVISPDTGLPGVPLGPYVMGPDGSAASPNPQVNELLGAIETTYRSYPHGPGPVPGIGNALAEPKRAEISAGLETLRLRVDWPENAPRYYLEKAGENRYRKVKLADRAGFMVTLTRTEREGVPVIVLELVRCVIEGGEYDAGIGARVGRPLVLQTTCTASAPVLPDLTTVVTWRLPDGVRAVRVLDKLPMIGNLFRQTYRLHATSPCLQIRMRTVGARSTP